MRAQITLEALVVFAGLLAFWVAWFGVVGPVQEEAKNQVVMRLEQAAFERVAFALRLAQRLGRGTRVSEEVYLPVDTMIELDGNLTWSFQNTTWFSASRGFGEKKKIQGRRTAVVENIEELRLKWEN